MSHPDGLPDLFLDRSLGRVQVPRLLRAAGLRLTTLAEHHGMPEDEDVTDVEWLELAGRHGWAVFLKDARIRSRGVERRAVQRFGVRCFCITRQDLTAVQMVERYCRHLDAITEACAAPGPFVGRGGEAQRADVSAIGSDISQVPDEGSREIPVELEPHAVARRRSRIAANAMAARMCSAVSSGKSATISWSKLRRLRSRASPTSSSRSGPLRCSRADQGASGTRRPL